MTSEIKPGDWVRIINDNHGCADVVVGGAYKVIRATGGDTLPIDITVEVNDTDYPRAGSYEKCDAPNTENDTCHDYTVDIRDVIMYLVANDHGELAARVHAEFMPDWVFRSPPYLNELNGPVWS